MIGNLTKTEALRIQAEQMEGLRPKLSDDCWAALAAWVQEHNNSLPSDASGHEVKRGVDLDRFIANWEPEDYSDDPFCRGC